VNSREAFAILAAPRFGDPKHIAAVKHIEDVESAREAFGKCRHGKCARCKGSGTALLALGGRVTEPCDDCAGSGKNAACHCFDGLSSDAILEAKRSI
jgi:DnaJ-class molecular chaperone